MAISVGAAVGAGFGLIRRRPLSVIAWGVPPMLLQLATFAVIGPFYLSMMQDLIKRAATGSTAVDPGLMSRMLQFEGYLLLIDLLQLFVAAMIYCAVFRAVIHPERRAFAYLRAAPPELFMTVLIFGAFAAMFVAMFALLIPSFIAVAVMAPAQQVAFATWFPLVVLVGMFAALVYFGLRFSLAGPMMVDDGKFHFFESWQWTRHRMGSLLLIVLALFGVFIVFEIVFVVILVTIGGAAFSELGGVPALSAALRQPADTLLRKIWPLVASYTVLLTPLFGCGVAIAGAPFAKVYLDLRPDAAELFA